MSHFSKSNTTRTPFGNNEFLRSTRDVKTESYTMAKGGIPTVTIDGDVQKVLQPGTVISKITSGPDAGKVGVFQAVGTSEVQTVTITGAPTGGTFTLTYDGQTTTAIAWNATAATVVAALEALSNISAGGVTGTGGPFPATAVAVTFLVDAGAQNVSQMTATGAFTGGTTPSIAVATTTGGVAGATDGRQTAANIVGVADTFLPWQLLERDVEIAVVYEATVVQAWCFEYTAPGAPVALTNTTRDAMLALPNLALLFK